MGSSRISIRLVIVCVLIDLCGLCYGDTYKVGDASGWSNNGQVNYKDWASDKKFYVGDTIVFSYDKKYHNVIQLTHLDYHACNITTPLAVYSDGENSIILAFPGHYYFTCGFPNHCSEGQKVDFKVLDLSNPSTSVSSPPPAPTASPALKSAASSSTVYSSFRLLGLIAMGFWAANCGY